MTGKTSNAVVDIATHPLVFVVGLRVGMTRDTGEYLIITRRSMTIAALIPFAPMLAGIDREVLGVVIKRRWGPCVFIVTGRTILRKLQGLVIRIIGLVVVVNMATGTRIWCVIIIPVVTSCALIGNTRMGTIQYVVVVMVVQ